MSFADEKGKREPALTPGKLSLFDELLAALNRNSPRQVDAE